MTHITIVWEDRCCSGTNRGLRADSLCCCEGRDPGSACCWEGRLPPVPSTGRGVGGVILRGSLHRRELQVSMDTHYSQPKDENLTQPMSILHVKTWHCAARLRPTQYSEQNLS